MYHGEYTLQETVIMTQLNFNMQARDLERMTKKRRKKRQVQRFSLKGLGINANDTFLRDFHREIFFLDFFRFHQ